MGVVSGCARRVDVGQRAGAHGPRPSHCNGEGDCDDWLPIAHREGVYACQERWSSCWGNVGGVAAARCDRLAHIMSCTIDRIGERITTRYRNTVAVLAWTGLCAAAHGATTLDLNFVGPAARPVHVAKAELLLVAWGATQRIELETSTDAEQWAWVWLVDGDTEYWRTAPTTWSTGNVEVKLSPSTGTADASFSR